MKKILLLLFFPAVVFGQTFWTETFSNGCDSGCTTYSGPNGTWTETSTGTNDAEANIWYISGAECGNVAGNCGSQCGAIDPSLHISSVYFLADEAAIYNAGGMCGTLFCVTTNMRIESPTINCSSKSNLVLSFNYIENGDGTNDDATVWYNDGSSWSQIDSLVKTPLTCAPQGLWTAFSITLPASANNNPNVKIGFNWTNNDDGVGTDPSIAIDDIQLCADTCSTGPTSVAATSTDATCSGNDGAITVTGVTGGTPPFTYSIDGINFQSSTTFNNLAAGSYSLAAKDSNGYTISTVVIVNSIPGPASVSAIGTNPSSCDSANGNIVVGSVIGGTTPYVYSIDGINFQSSTAFSGLDTGIYTVTAKDTMGCTVSTNVTLSCTTTSISALIVEFNFLIKPNPFSHQTQILYTLSSTSQVNIEIYNLLGKKEIVLLNEAQNAGKQQLNINGDALKLAPGIYFLKIKLNQTQFTQKLVKL